MDDRRFDDLTKALAKGANRRSLLKGMLGLGGAAVTGGLLRAGETDAGRRPTPTPKPPTCPGQQIRCATGCCCPNGTTKCGPECCNTSVPAGNPAHSECCDGACCFGSCYGEELCCATNSRSGGRLPTNRVCATVDGSECCAYSDACCAVDGCCATVCTGGVAGDDLCCAADHYCPGGSSSEDRCCTGDTPIQCACGTNANACIADDAAACCVDADCVTPPSGSTPCIVATCQAHVCVYTDCDTPAEVCCSAEGTFVCEPGPYCGCDTDADCAASNNPAECKVGICNRGVCETVAAPNTTVCHPAGASAICDPAVMCTGEDQSCPGADYAPVDTDCGDCRICNGLGVCSSKCTGDTPECCVNPWGEFCIPEGETCCGGPDDCPGDCDYCNDEVWYCVERCGGATPTCCQSPQGSYCLPQDGVCCTSDDDCDGACDVCSDYPGACTSACSGADSCCTEGGTEECCAADRCIPGEGCCASGIECAQCCGEGEKCCYDSYCIAEDLTCCQGPVQCRSLNYCTNDPVWHSFTCAFELGYCVETTQVCNGGNVCLDYSCARETGCSQTGINTGAPCGKCLVCSSAGACDVSLGTACGDACCGDGEVCCGDDHCIPRGRACCLGNADCPSFCSDLTWHDGSCGPGGYCVETLQDCFDGSLCTNDFCSASTGCSHTPVVCDDVVCLINLGCGYDGNPACTYGLVTCGTSCGGGNRCDGNGNCVASPSCP